VSDIKYVQIANTIEQRIKEGLYSANSKLPPHRVLADELHTTPVTVAKAYKLLASKQLVESFVGKGSFVCAPSSLSQVIQPPEDDQNYNFSILQPCLYKNVQPLKNAMQQASEHLSADFIGYTEHSGHETHRLAGVNWAKHFGLTGGTVKNTLLTDGAQHALSLLINAMTEPGDTIAVEALTYPGILAIASLAGRRVVGIPLDNEGVSPTALERVLCEEKPILVIIIPSHQNPTGITMPESRRRAIAEIIDKHDSWLVEDDIYCFLNETPIPAISNFIPDKSFHISGLSKAISPALRCGYLRVPDSQVGKMKTHIRANIWLSSPITYMLATSLIESGEAFEIAKVQRQTAIDRQLIASHYLTNVQNTPAGYHIWLPLPAHWSRERFLVEANQRGIIVSSGGYFSVSGENDSFIRLSLMAISSEQRLKEGLQALQSLMSSDVVTDFSS